MRTLGVVAVGIVVGSGIALVRHRGAAPMVAPPPPRNAVSAVATGRIATARPPRPARVVPQIDLAPTDPRYDALELMDQQNGLLSPREIFEREPRDPQLSPVMEARIRASLDEAFAELGLGDKIQQGDTSATRWPASPA